MADEKPAPPPEQSSDEPPPVSVPSHDPLPPPPEVHYTRPVPKAPPGSSPSARQAGPSTGSDVGGSGFTKLGSGLAAATTFVASVVAGFLIGQWVDHCWGRPGGTPWGTLVFSLLGVAAGFLNLFRVLAATDRGGKK